MTADRLITVAIHTYHRAASLKALLESNGVNATLQNVNLSRPVVSPGVRVRIRESDLPLALRIIENTDTFPAPKADMPASDGSFVLVPTDFSQHSVRAVDLAFHLAHREKSRIVLLNTYIDPYFYGNTQLTDASDFEPVDSEIRRTLADQARSNMARLADSLKKRIADGSLPDVKFVTEIVEGIPEEVIGEYSKLHVPELIVMGTRGSDKKEKELIGSVTAEVLDSCRYPIITVPEMVSLNRIDDIRHMVLLCNLDQEDILAVDAIYRMFADEQIHVSLVNVPSKKPRLGAGRSMDSLYDYCSVHYPRFSFTVQSVGADSIDDDFLRMAQPDPIDMIAVPNKKKNIFARLFNPSIAHRLLFHADIPMIAIPV